MSAAHDPIEHLLTAFTARQPIRTGSLIVTVFGDVILPRGGAVLLSDLMTLLEAFALNDSQVRTAISRLVADGWLEGERLGRRSLYRLTGTGRHRFEEATRRIYFGPPQEWRGEWHVVVLPAGEIGRGGELRKDLGWLGFGTLAPGVLLHPAPDRRSLRSVIEDLPENARPLIVAGPGAPLPPPELLRELVAKCWDWQGLGESYRQFLDTFTPLRAALAGGVKPDPLPALLARLMLVHDYRRIVLRDPMLPPVLLPEQWVGAETYAMARDIYRRLAPAAENWVAEHLRDDRGLLRPPETGFGARFP